MRTRTVSRPQVGANPLVRFSFYILETAHYTRVGLTLSERAFSPERVTSITGAGHNWPGLPLRKPERRGKRAAVQRSRTGLTWYVMEHGAEVRRCLAAQAGAARILGRKVEHGDAQRSL